MTFIHTICKKNHDVLLAIKYFCFLILFLILLFISGCTSYTPAIHHYATKELPKLTPHYVAIKHGHIEYYDSGKGSPVILIAGYRTDVSSWNREFIAALAAHHRVIIPNNRLVGGSNTSSVSYDAHDLAEDYYQLIQKLRLNHPAVIGISMGGMIAQKLAVLHPEVLGHLILINTAIAGKHAVQPSAKIKNKLLTLPQHKFGFYIAAIDLFFPAKWKMKMAYSLVADRFQPKKYTEIKPNLVMTKQQKLIFNWINDNETETELTTLPLPVLILNGKADSVIPPVNSVILAHHLPHAHLIRFDEGGHAMIYQFPVAIANQINLFLTNHKLT